MITIAFVAEVSDVTALSFQERSGQPSMLSNK